MDTLTGAVVLIVSINDELSKDVRKHNLLIGINIL